MEIQIQGIQEEESLPGSEHEPADGGEEETGLQTRVDKINSFYAVLNGDWDGIADCLQVGNSGEILSPVNVCVDVDHRERPFFQGGENLVFEVKTHGLAAHKPS